MHSYQLLGLAAVGSLVSAAPAPSRVSEFAKKASTCTFTSASEASESISSCSDVVLSGIEVPAGETLDLSDAADGSTVCVFQPSLTFANTLTSPRSPSRVPLLSATRNGRVL